MRSNWLEHGYHPLRGQPPECCWVSWVDETYLSSDGVATTLKGLSAQE